MLDSGNRRASLMGALAIAMAAAGSAQVAMAAMPPPRKDGSRDYKPTAPRRDTALAREIAEHNAAVDRRKAEKKARKQP